MTRTEDLSDVKTLLFLSPLGFSCCLLHEFLFRKKKKLILCTKIVSLAVRCMNFALFKRFSGANLGGICRASAVMHLAAEQLGFSRVLPTISESRILSFYRYFSSFVR